MIPTNSEGEMRTLAPAKSIKYLGMWLDSHLSLTKHVRKATSKAMTATHSLKLLGNSERGIHQMLWRQLYYGAILPTNHTIWAPSLLEIMQWPDPQSDEMTSKQM